MESCPGREIKHAARTVFNTNFRKNFWGEKTPKHSKVCMKIIKNDKDFFDQSMDEIKLLNFINVNTDVDETNVLKLIDYFYHKEHLIIVTELLKYCQFGCFVLCFFLQGP